MHHNIEMYVLSLFLQMKKYNIPRIHSYQTVDVNPLHCPVSTASPCEKLTNYTLAGLYGSKLQANVAKETFVKLYEASTEPC